MPFFDFARTLQGAFRYALTQRLSAHTITIGRRERDGHGLAVLFPLQGFFQAGDQMPCPWI